MPRSSRHRSHRSRKHSRDRSESEEDETSREMKPSVEEPAASPGARVSRDPDPGKRRSLRASDGKDMVGTCNGDAPVEYVKKRKERADEAAVAERWNDDEEDDCKRSKREEFSPLERHKSSKSKPLDVDSKGRSSRRHDELGERNEDSGMKVDSAKGKSERDLSRRESSSHYKDARERDRLERQRDRDRDRSGDAQTMTYDRSDDFPRRKHGSQTGSTEEEYVSNKDTKIIESQVHDVLPNAELEKGLEKHTRRRDDSEVKDKLLGDHRDSDDRRLSSRDDHTTDRSYRDERHEDIKYGDKYRDDLCRDQKQQNDKHRDERSSRGRASERSENRHFRDENKPSEGRYKKSRQHDNDHDGSFCPDDRDSRGKKRLYEENEDHGNSMPREMMEPREDVEKNVSSNSRIDSHIDLPRSGRRHQERVDYSPRNNQSKSSASSTAYDVEDCKRDSSKQEASARKGSSFEERIHSGAAFTRNCSLASGADERVSETRYEKIKPKDDIQLGELYEETVMFPKHDRTSRSIAHASPDQMKEKSPSTNDQRFSDVSGSRLSLDLGVGQKRRTSRDGDRGDLALEKPFLEGISQNEISNREATPSSLINRTSHLFGSSANHLPPPLPGRFGIDSPSVFGSYEDDNREQSGNSKHYGHYKRSGDLGFGRGHGNWKSIPSWPSPMENGFNPLQHGLPPAGFHPAVPQFPSPPLFGVRPYNMHDVADSFPGPGRPFGWHNALNQPHMQMWDANNGMFGNDTHIYGRPEWDLNRHLVGSRGWEMGVDMWKGQDCSINIPKKESEQTLHALAEEAWVPQPGDQSRKDRVQLEPLLAENTEAKHSSDVSPAKNTVVSPLKLVPKKTPELSEITGGGITNSIAKYLSRIDVSPILVNPELYRKCTFLLGVKGINAACNLFTHQQFQINNDESIDKMKNTSYILKSLLPTAKDDIFQRAMSLYKQQNERSRVKIPASPPVCSDEVKGGSAEASHKEKVQVGEQPPLEKTFLPDPKCEAGDNITSDSGSDCPGGNKHQQFDLKSDDAVNYANGSQACEALAEDCRRHNNPESTR